MSVVDINDFDIRCLTFNKINPDYQAKLDKEGKGIRNQYSIYPKYEGKQLSLCLTINSLEGGQTSNKDKTGKEFCDIEASNIKFNIGLNPKYEECVKLKEVIRSIEDKLKKNIGDLLEAVLDREGKKFRNYTFSSCIIPYFCSFVKLSTPIKNLVSLLRTYYLLRQHFQEIKY